MAQTSVKRRQFYVYKAAKSALVALALLFSTTGLPLDGRADAEAVSPPPRAAGPALGADLAPGKFIWDETAVPSGAILVSIGLEDQLVHVYRDGALAGISTISSGRPGYETPRGVYTILQKKKKHRSNLYDDAPMPYMQRLTWDGVALHAGRLPGYPDSHGCIRLPKDFARLLYGATRLGTTVIVGARVYTPAAASGLGLDAGFWSAPTEAMSSAGLAAATTTAELNRAVLERLPKRR